METQILSWGDIMNRVSLLPVKALTGVLLTAACAFPQAYTISARPGAVNYIEGSVLLDGKVLVRGDLKSTFLSTNDTLEVQDGKAEVLLTPGVFLRLGDHSQVRMISPSLIDLQLEVQHGEAMLEVDELLKDNRISVLDHGGSILLAKPGLYRFTGDDPPTAAVLEGSAYVYFGAKKVDLKKGHDVILSDQLEVAKFDLNRPDELYAWSNVRSQSNAAMTYQASRAMAYSPSGSAFGGSGTYGYGYPGYGYPGAAFGSGWFWNGGYSSWCWMPFGDGYFSPFGWGFYSPSLVAYAPVVLVPEYAGGGYVHLRRTNPQTPTGATTNSLLTGSNTAAATSSNGLAPGVPLWVPVNPKSPGAVGVVASSPASYATARSQALHTAAATGGFRTSTGWPAASFQGGQARTGAVRPSTSYSGGGGGSRTTSGTSSSAISSSSSASRSSGSSIGSAGGGFHGGGSIGGSGGGKSK